MNSYGHLFPNHDDALALALDCRLGTFLIMADILGYSMTPVW
jgi:hypothetical protein